MLILSKRSFIQYNKKAVSYWRASVLPALAGTTLPFWLNPPGFTFKWFEAGLFLIATFLCHTGFANLYDYFKDNFSKDRKKKETIITGIICITASIFIGIFLNSLLRLPENVYEHIFIVYGVTVIITGLLYVVPPFNFYRHSGGETILSVGLGMLPVLGAYLVQAGDLTRTVYLASMPIVFSTGLWLWIIELINKDDDEKSGYQTIVMLFPHRFSGRMITGFLTLSIYGSLILAVIGRSSLHPLSLIALFSAGFTVKIISLSWNGYSNRSAMMKARKYAILIHLIICLAIIASSLFSILIK